MRAVTWSRDSHGLFDYESRHISKKSLKTYSSGKLIRSNNEINFVPLMTNITADFGEEAKSLLTLKSDKQTNNGYIIENPHFNERENLRKAELPAQSENMYLVVRSLKNQDGKQDYTIKEKDIIKLGRVKFKIKECCTETHPVKP